MTEAGQPGKRIETAATPSRGANRYLVAAILGALVLVSSAVSVLAAMGWGGTMLLNCHACHM
jgi:hypothetical protein